MTQFSLISYLFRRICLAVLFLFFLQTSRAQVTLFSENFGVPTATTTLANYAIGNSPATFQNPTPISFTGTGSIRITSISSGYVGASGGGNVLLAVGQELIVSNINSAAFVNLALSFGVLKTDNNASSMSVDVSSDGINYTSLTYSLPSGAGTAVPWYYRTATGTIPSTTTLSIRFKNNSATAQYRIDDVLLTGDIPGIVSAQSGNWSSTATWVGGIVPNSATNAVISSGHAVVMDNLSYATRDAGVSTTVSTTGTLATGLAITNNGNMVVNGNFQINQGGFGGGSGTWTYGPSSTLIYNHTSGNYGPVDNTHTYWPSTSGPTNVTIQNSSSGGVSLAVARTVSGIFQTAAGVFLNSVNLTINGQAIINAGGYFQQSPIYGVSSLLKYNCNCTYGRGSEWLTGAGTVGTTPGYPNDVQISNTTTLNTPNTGGGSFSSTLTVGRDLTIDAASSVSMNFGGGGNKSGSITVNRNVLINGTITLGDAVGGDLTVKGNWTNNGTFNSNSRTVYLNGSTLQTISGSVVTTFAGLSLNNTAGFTLSAVDCSVDGTMELLTGKFTTTAARKVIVTSSGSVFRSSGWVFGNMQRHFVSGTNISRTFDIGNTSGHLSSTLTFADVSTAGSIIMSVNDGDISSIASSPLISTASINRHWSIRNIDLVTNSTYSAQLNFITTDKDVACNISTIRAAVVNSGTWQLYANITATTNSATVSGITITGIDSLALGNEKGDLNYRTKASGNWENSAIWEVSNDNISWSNATDVPNATTSNATIRATHTVQRSVNSPYTVKNITVDPGGTLLTNVTNNNYFNIYGNITCNGTIGNTTDNISFNIEGTNDTIRGSGSFSCKRIRKSATTNQTTNLFIDMDITTYWNTSASLYNNSDNSSWFNVTVNTGRTVRCASVCIDGVRGNGTANGGGTFLILGNLYADTLYLTTDNNAAGFGAHVNIANGGFIYSNTIHCNASGLSGHQLTVQDGGTLYVTGSNGFSNFSTAQNTYTLGSTSTIHYSATANQTIESGLSSYGHIQFSGSGNKTPNGSFSIRGDWTRANPAIFVPLLHTITFNGTTSSNSPQKIRITGVGGTETFSYIILQKGAGQKLQLADDTPTSIQVLGGNGGQPIQLKSGIFDLNGQTLYMPMVTSGLVNNIGIDGSIADQERKISSTKTGGIFQIFNADASARFVSINKINSANSPRLLIDTGATMIVGGLNQNSGIDFGSGLTYFSGTFQINTWGYVENNPPYYNTGSYLVYNPGGEYNRFKEWDSSSGAGYPHHVILRNSSSVLLNNDSPGGNGKADRALAGNLTIEAGSTLKVGDSTENNKLTINKSLILDGELRMPSGDTLSLADVYVGQDWIRSSTGTFTHNNKGVHFFGDEISNISASGGQFYPYLFQEKSARAIVSQMSSPVYIGKKMKIITGDFDLKDSDLYFYSDENFSARFAEVEDGDLVYSGTGRAVVERYIPIDSSLSTSPLPTGKHRKSWQFLAVPTFGPQTINQAWQDSASSPNQNRYPGYGTQITGSVANATNPSIGFDVFTSTPSIKQYSPATNTWIGTANTVSTPIESKKGYMLFVRGDRSVTTFNAPGKSTILRTRGKLFSPANPQTPTTIQANQFESIGNPYVSPIDFKLVGKTGVSVENSFWVWDPLLTGVEGLGGYQLLSAVNGDYLPTPGGTANYPTAQKCSTIQAGQAFFMHAPAAGSVTVSFDENCKSEAYASAFRTNGNTGKYLRIQLNTETNGQANTLDGAVVAWKNSYRKSIDAFDAIKLLNPGSSISLQYPTGQKLAIDARPLPRLADTIPLTLSLARYTNYILHFEPEQMNDGAYSIGLYDQYTDSMHTINASASTDITVQPLLPLSQNISRYFIIITKRPNRSQTPLPLTSNTYNSAKLKSGTSIYGNVQKNEIQFAIGNLNLPMQVGSDERVSAVRVFDAQARLIWMKNTFSIPSNVLPIRLECPIMNKGIYFIQATTNTGNSYFVHFFSK